MCGQCGSHVVSSHGYKYQSVTHITREYTSDTPTCPHMNGRHLGDAALCRGPQSPHGAASLYMFDLDSALLGRAVQDVGVGLKAAIENCCDFGHVGDLGSILEHLQPQYID